MATNFPAPPTGIPNVESTPTDLSHELVLESYRFSANRALAAIDGHLSVTNSREPSSAPPGPDVTGLCGQGGRHPYFRVSESELRSTAEAIVSANTLDTVAAACQRLRRLTVFDDHTNCVNDRLPAIVPLLPPEEVWLQNRELPLDVWRLLSFDIDLVSSAMSAHVPLDDIAFGSLTQSGLVFRALISRIQAVSVELATTGHNLTAAFPTHFPLRRYKLKSLSLVSSSKPAASSHHYVSPTSHSGTPQCDTSTGSRTSHLTFAYVTNTGENRSTPATAAYSQRKSRLE
jgi:hypothetical protein